MFEFTVTTIEVDCKNRSPTLRDYAQEKSEILGVTTKITQCADDKYITMKAENEETMTIFAQEMIKQIEYLYSDSKDVNIRHEATTSKLTPITEFKIKYAINKCLINPLPHDSPEWKYERRNGYDVIWVEEER